MKKLVSIFLLAALVFGAAAGAALIPPKLEEAAAAVTPQKDTLYFWYADESLTDYLTNASAAYYERSGYHVIPLLRTGLEYLEEINDASVHRTEESPQMPDLYIICNDSLEKAYLSGLARTLEDQRGICNTETFPQTALDAVTYQGKYVGYPFYYETSALLYNKTYMEEAEQEAPKTVDDILAFADAYDAPEQVEAVFKWDVTDIFYNYYFIGNYMIVGGEAGDDASRIDISNGRAKKCMEVYQNLNQFFSIDTKEISYDSVLQDFIDGKIVMTVATSDCLARLEAARAEGDFAYEYGVEKMPDLTDALKGRSLSVTYAAVVNGYSDSAAQAEDFAAFLTKDYAEGLYSGTGKMASRRGVSYENKNADAFVREYADSISMPKLLGTSNFWVQLEICFSKIWTGEEIDGLIDDLENQIKNQL